MKTWLLESMNENSILCLAIGSLVGALLGNGLNFLFNYVLLQVFKNRTSAKIKWEKYAYQLKSTSESLCTYIKIYIKEPNNYYEKDSYFKLSLLYWFSALFGWITFFEKKIATGISNRKMNKIIRLIFHIKKSLNSPKYFDDIYNMSIIGKYSFHNMMIRAIGEIMLIKEEGEERTVSFIEFIELYKDIKYVDWFNYLDTFISGIEKSDIKHNRLILIQINLKILIFTIMPYTYQHTIKRAIINLKEWSKTIQNRLYYKKDHIIHINSYYAWRKKMNKKYSDTLFDLFPVVKKNLYSEMRGVEKNVGSQFKLCDDLNCFYEQLSREVCIFKAFPLNDKTIFSHQKIRIIYKENKDEDELYKGYISQILPEPLHVKFAYDNSIKEMFEKYLTLSIPSKTFIYADVSIESSSGVPIAYIIKQIHIPSSE